MAKKALVFLAEGFEEVEAVTPIDYLRRAGIEVMAVSTSGEKTVKGAHGIGLAANAVLGDFESSGRLDPSAWDAVFIPGGMPGASNLAACPEVGQFFREMAAAGKVIAAICASPAVVLGPLGLLEGKKWTCYPGMEDRVRGGKHSPDKVALDGNLVTSRGPGTAKDFALALITILAGEGEAKKLQEAALL